MTAATSKDVRQYGPLVVDIGSLGAGVLAMATEHKDSACLALGMMPAAIMEILERQLKEKIPDAYYWRDGGPNVDDRVHDDGAEIRESITRDVVVYILRNGPNIL